MHKIYPQTIVQLSSQRVPDLPSLRFGRHGRCARLSATCPKMVESKISTRTRLPVSLFEQTYQTQRFFLVSTQLHLSLNVSETASHAAVAEMAWQISALILVYHMFGHDMLRLNSFSFPVCTLETNDSGGFLLTEVKHIACMGIRTVFHNTMYTKAYLKGSRPKSRP